MTNPFRIFIGWDKREPIAYDVAKFSLERRASIPVQVSAIKLDDLRARGLYRRAEDPLATTEFTYSRFLTPALAGYQGWALFCDCDFLFLGDIAGLAEYTKTPKAVYCVQHDYQPKESIKMDGKVQTTYPRKNWSSFMLFNNAHPAVKALTPALVNRESPAFLHRFNWVSDELIGELPRGWNFLEGEYPRPDKTPAAVHFTNGGPWFPQWQNVEFGDLWRAERDRYLQSLQGGMAA